MIYGVDVSEAQGWDPHVHQVPDWERVAASGLVSFASCKATQGQGYVDRAFVRNWAGIKRVGMPRISYHFADADATARDCELEAEHHWSTIERAGFDDGDWHTLDMEKAQIRGTQFTDWTLGFCDRLRELSGVRTSIYCGGPFMNEHDGEPDEETMRRLASHQLWLAAYVTQPENYVPNAWKRFGRSYLLWQKSGDYDWTARPGTGKRIPGIATVVDWDECRLTIEWLRELIADQRVGAVPHHLDTAPPEWQPQASVETVAAELFADLARDDDELPTEPATPTSKSGEMAAVKP